MILNLGNVIAAQVMKPHADETLDYEYGSFDAGLNQKPVKYIHIISPLLK